MATAKRDAAYVALVVASMLAIIIVSVVAGDSQ